MKVISPREGDVYTKVSELIDPLTDQWDDQLLRIFLNDLDVRRSFQISLNNQWSLLNMADTLFDLHIIYNGDTSLAQVLGSLLSQVPREIIQCGRISGN
jgi:hypothetical protein